MKKILFVLVTMVMSLVSCTDQQFSQEALAGDTSIVAYDEFSTLIEQARWGYGQALRGGLWVTPFAAIHGRIVNMRGSRFFPF